jgi:leucyl-tRNA synthetase
MDTFMCSSWYHLRYLSPEYDQAMFDPREYDYWMPVDTYTGGIEHATMHLIYTRFFHKAGRDMGIMEGHEPMTQLRNQGMVLGEDGEKMSKSRGNVVAPDKLVNRYGADVVRAYLMFFARWDLGGPWDSQGVEGPNRWVRRVWTLFTESHEPTTIGKGIERDLRRKTHQTLKSVTRDFENFEFNTIVSSLMELLNYMYSALEKGASGTPAWEEVVEIYIKMMAPVTPHVAEELWVEVLGKPYSVHDQAWPEIDENALIEDEVTLVVQVDGKVRDRIQVPLTISKDDAKATALASEAVQRFMQGAEPNKVIYIPGRLINIVT